MNLNQAARKAKNYNFERELLNIVSLNDKIALNLNRDSQLFEQGIDSKGNPISPEYTPFTVEMKRFSNQPSDRVTLRDTEDFHNSFFMDASKFPIRIDATDSKTSELKGKYGEDIFGLTEDSQGDFNKAILGDVQESNTKAI